MEKKLNLKKKVDNFLFNWHQFPIDFWWRKKYHVSFGSPEHRNMNFIDMYIEYEEEQEINKILNKAEEEEDFRENEEFGLNNFKEEKMSQEEIDEDYENLDIENFNN